MIAIIVFCAALWGLSCLVHDRDPVADRERARSKHVRGSPTVSDDDDHDTRDLADL